MAIKHVKSDTLNLRSAPIVADGNIIGELLKGQRVDTLAPVDANGWVSAQATVNGVLRQGFVKERLLRDPASDAKESLITAAVAEWVRFERGTGREDLPPFFTFVGEMWKQVGEPNLDGRNRDQPWSAAFISFIVRKAGAAYAGFKFHEAHARYIHDSIVKREAGTPAPFWGFRLNEHKVGLGDLVCQWRVSKVTFDDARRTNEFTSHCDVVVEVGPGFVRTLGGNVGHTVGFKTYDVDGNGFLEAENNLFAVMRNNV